MIPQEYYLASHIVQDKTTPSLRRPQEQGRTWREMREGERTWCGIFHSRPSLKSHATTHGSATDHLPGDHLCRQFIG